MKQQFLLLINYSNNLVSFTTRVGHNHTNNEALTIKKEEKFGNEESNSNSNLSPGLLFQQAKMRRIKYFTCCWNFELLYKILRVYKLSTIKPSPFINPNLQMNVKLYKKHLNTDLIDTDCIITMVIKSTIIC